MSAWASGSRNMRGFGLPGCGRGVTVPASMKPKPNVASPARCSAFLSSPAASPTRFGNVMPITVTGDPAARAPNARATPNCAARSSAANVNSCAVSGSSANRKGRASG